MGSKSEDTAVAFSSIALLLGLVFLGAILNRIRNLDKVGWNTNMKKPRGFRSRVLLVGLLIGL